MNRGIRGIRLLIYTSWETIDPGPVGAGAAWRAAVISSDYNYGPAEMGFLIY